MLGSDGEVISVSQLGSAMLDSGGEGDKVDALHECIDTAKAQRAVLATQFFQ